ncbi:MAG: hypothetical protein GW778_03455 [Alphaproteobacteria bacterium]|nr:hypothetical protein [Alphaproteobacteria bacterium]
MLHYRDTTRGSFEMWGNGFRYDYDNNKSALSVFHHESERLLAQFKFDSLLLKEPRTYVGFLDKASQINALMVSNNSTVNLAETMPLRHVAPIFQSIGVISRHAFDLHILDLPRFSERFAQEYGLKSINIKPFKSRDCENAFFIARLQTLHDNCISVRACTLGGIMGALSESTLRDLMTMEFGHRYNGSAQNLLNASSKLSSLSYILDESFVPEMKVFSSNTDKIDYIHSKSTH